ncbi:MAG: hypothetical protein AAGB34_09425 [Planctomycetota bacterium]
MRHAAENRSYRVISELTGQNSETVRRYMQGAAPSVEFVSRLCDKLGLNAHWLLTGSGPMRADEQRSAALREASPAELLSHIAGTLDRLTGRVDRIESFVQTLEARVRLQAEGMISNERHDEGSEASGGDRARARFIADAVPERPSEDDA